MTVLDRRERSDDGVRTVDLSADVVDTIDGARTTIGSMTLAIVGMGYVGLPTALAGFAAGARVIGLDINEERLAEIRAQRVDAVPSDLDRLEDALKSERLTLTSDPAALEAADAVVICVPTPVDEHRAPDLTALWAACRTAVAHARAGQVLIMTSTSYVGTTRDLLVVPLAARGFTVGEDVFVAYSPERIDPGNTKYPMETVPRVVGGATPACAARAARILGAIAETIHLVSTPDVAELMKLYENIFRAVNIALANEFADIARELNIPINEVTHAASTKPFGYMPFYPGTGAGGHCIPCDPHYLLGQLADRSTAPIVSVAMAAIAARPRQIVDRAQEMLAADGLGLRDARVLVVGVAYKPGIQDTRESPGIEILRILNERGVEAHYIDPLVPSVTLPDGQRLSSVEPPEDEAYDLVIVSTLHPRFPTAWIRRQPRILDPGEQLGRLS